MKLSVGVAAVVFVASVTAINIAIFSNKPVLSLTNPSGTSVVAVEHGFKTDRVVATRYENSALGYNIGFDFPLNKNEADRAEVGDFFEAHGGTLVQGGGYPGATDYVVFKGVADADAADKKLREILPDLSRLITALGNGETVKIALPKPQYEWPNAPPPDKSNPYWKFNGNLNVNGTQYERSEVEPGKWQWVVDQEAMREREEMEAKRRDLYQALRTRRLSDDEMKQALSYGDRLNIDLMVSYSASEKASELNDAWLTQNRIRAIGTN